MYDLGVFIKEKREKKGLTQKELAVVLKCEPQFMSLVENGHSKLPLGLASKLCSTLEIDPSLLEKYYVHEYRKVIREYLK